LVFEEETKPTKRRILTLKRPVEEFFDGGDVNAEADNKPRVLKADDTNVKFSVSSLFSSPTDEAIKSLSDIIVEEKTITGTSNESGYPIFKSITNAYGPKLTSFRVAVQDKLYGLKRIQDKIS